MQITNEHLNRYHEHLVDSGYKKCSIQRKLNSLKHLIEFTGERQLSPDLMARYREHIIGFYNTPRSRNGIVSETNQFLRFIGCPELLLESVEYDHYKLYGLKETQLSAEELSVLIDCARREGKLRTELFMRIFATTGIRAGELVHITVEAVAQAFAEIEYRGRKRQITLPQNQCSALLDYAQQMNISSGSIFITRNGTPLDVRYVCMDLKDLAARAGIDRNKVSPNAFRILFAQTYYKKYGDIAGLTDLLGIKDVESTVLYIKN